MRLKRLLSSCFCLSGSIFFSLNNHVNAKMEGIPVTESDILSIAKDKLYPLMLRILDGHCGRGEKGKDELLKYVTECSENAYKFCSEKKLSDFSKIFGDICKNVEDLKYLDCLTVSTYFSKLLNDKGIQNTVVYFPLYQNTSGEKQGTYTFHSLVLYAYREDVSICYKFADPYGFIIGVTSCTWDIEKLIMDPIDILLKNVGSYDNWALSDDEALPMPVPLMNWINEAAKELGIDISSYNKIANKYLSCSKNFKTLIKIDNKWMIKKGDEEFEEDRLFAQKPVVKIPRYLDLDSMRFLSSRKK